MNNINLKPLIAAMAALAATASAFSMGDLAETYIRNPKIPKNKYNRIMDLAYNHRKFRVRKKNLNRLRKSQIYIGWDLNNV